MDREAGADRSRVQGGGARRWWWYGAKEDGPWKENGEGPSVG
jgi:hypothetical protein